MTTFLTTKLLTSKQMDQRSQQTIWLQNASQQLRSETSQRRHQLAHLPLHAQHHRRYRGSCHMRQSADAFPQQHPLLDCGTTLKQQTNQIHKRKPLSLAIKDINHQANNITLSVSPPTTYKRKDSTKPATYHVLRHESRSIVYKFRSILARKS